MISYDLYLLGLVLDILGAGILFFFGVPPYSPKASGAFVGTGNNTKGEIYNTKWYKIVSHFGFGLIFIGVIIQFIYSYQNRPKELIESKNQHNCHKSVCH